MATQELAAMLDELMGRNRNANPNDKVHCCYLTFKCGNKFYQFKLFF
jgi:hypothetical protein